MNFVDISTFDQETDDLNVIVETPRGSRNKFDFDEEHRLFKLAKVLPEGMVFPFEFGFIPSTRVVWRCFTVVRRSIRNLGRKIMSKQSDASGSISTPDQENLMRLLELLIDRLKSGERTLDSLRRLSLHRGEDSIVIGDYEFQVVLENGSALHIRFVP